MELEGKVIQFLGETGGTSKAGNPWKKKEWLIETIGQYPKKVKVQCFGDRSDLINMTPGQNYRLSVDVESREYNGRWYTDVSVFRVQDYTEDPYAGNPVQSGGYQSPQPPVQPYGGMSDNLSAEPFNPSPMDSGEDLPF